MSMDRNRSANRNGDFDARLIEFECLRSAAGSQLVRRRLVGVKYQLYEGERDQKGELIIEVEMR